MKDMNTKEKIIAIIQIAVITGLFAVFAYATLFLPMGWWLY